jgi:hypothetical protein
MWTVLGVFASLLPLARQCHDSHMPDLQGMSIDIEGLMAEVEKFRNRLAQLGDELTLNSKKSASATAKEMTVRQDARAVSGQPEEPNAASDSGPEPESELAALVRSAFAHKSRRSRRS